MSRPTWTINNRTPEDKIPQFSEVVIGDFKINTTSTGAIESKPVSAPANQEPADVVQPASLRLTETALSLEATAEFGGSVLLSSLINSLLDVPGIISGDGLEMSLRSAFGRLFSSVAVNSSVIADISGVRLPAVLNEVVNNASLDEARALAQSLKDSVQDASGSLLELANATASASISALESRVTAVEAGMGNVDLSGVLTRLDGAEVQIAQLIDQKLDVATYEGEKPMFATASDYSNLDARVQGAEMSINGNAERLDALESALPTKVAQADYDVAIASLEASVASAQATADSASASASSAQATADGAEVKGLLSKLEVEDNSTAGVSETYWLETQGAVLAGIMDAHKIANYLFDAPASELTIPATVGGSSAVAGAVRRLRNAHPTAVLPISLEGVSYEIVAGETAVFQHNGTAWRLL